MKKIIQFGASAALLGTIACTASAQSSVTVSGVIDTGVMSVSHVGNGKQSELLQADSILGVSNVGFSGKEDLGGGLSSLFNLQAGFNPSDGTQSAQGQL